VRRSTNIARCVRGRPRKQEGSIALTIPVGSAAPKTPAQRLVELQGQIAALERDLAEANAKESRAQQRLLRYEGLGHASFGGIVAGQIWADFVLWEGLLNSKPFKAVFELGTWLGGFSWWLWAQCESRNMWFETYDSIEPERSIPGFHKMDVFAQAAEIGITMRLMEPCVVFCDNGNKPRELRDYAYQLEHPDSVLVVHDWGTEMLPENVPDTVEMIHREFCEEINSISRVFRVKERNA
jgi:hypothetical protein